ncbi:protein FAM98A [Hemiscyllium ocellatum]|uniref:protein FAM98A n=1 Tax=Hemiscyllium ocellatum TaxID=170820 RepID=UPI0029675A90|nr:protein FAM98A [Hemiscyllium ocellatum]
MPTGQKPRSGSSGGEVNELGVGRAAGGAGGERPFAAGTHLSLGCEMENDILDSLEDLGYKGPLLDDGALNLAAVGGAASPEYTKLCAWLVTELKTFYKLVENVNATASPTEAEEFQLEMSGLLAEMNCPYSVLTTGDVTKRLLNKNNCLLLLTYLISELESSRMLGVHNPPKKQSDKTSQSFMELKSICITLGMSKPPDNITMFQFFSGIEKKLKESLSKVPRDHVGKPLIKKALGPLHWEKLEAINQVLVNEYEIRRKMLLKRMDVTIQSFGWSDRAKTQTEKLAKVYQPKRAALSSRSTICVAHLLAAREDLSKIMRTSSGLIREKTACAVNKVLMGRVPDRGGRPNEIEPPPPEMPPWQKRPDNVQSSSGRGRGGYDQGSYGGGGRGGYEQSSYGGGGRGGYDHGSYGGGGRGGYEHSSYGRGGYDQGSYGGGGRGGYDQGGRGGGRGGYDRTEQAGRGGGRGKIQGGWSDGSGGHQDSSYQGGHGSYHSGGYHSGGYQGNAGYQGGGYHGGGGSYQGGGYQGGGYQGHQDNRNQDSSHEQGGGRGAGRGGRGRGGRGGRGGQGGGWVNRGGLNYNQGGQFEQYFQHGGQQYNASGFYQGRQYSS